jgi:hypothetical protein
MTLVGAGSLVAATMAPATAHPAARPAAGSIAIDTLKATPSTGLVDQQKVTVKVTAAAGHNFNKTPVLYVAECSSLAVTKLSVSYCDLNMSDMSMITSPSGTKATTSFTILTSAKGDFKPGSSKAVCGKGASLSNCILLVADSTTLADVTQFGQAPITFKDLRAASKTKVSSKKKVKVKKSLTLKAATTHKGTTKLTGTVTFFDNGKKLKKVKLSATGKATLKHTFKKAGKQHISVTYSGDNTYKPSRGKETVVVKK